jgi:hypothetical protein
MGRSPNFTLSNVPLPAPLPSSGVISRLKVGDVIRLALKLHDVSYGICRSISTYSYEPSPLSSHVSYRVTSVDVVPAFSEIGLRVISVIATNHPRPENHMDGWYITTDGYVRECEHFGIQQAISDVHVE